MPRVKLITVWHRLNNAMCHMKNTGIVSRSMIYKKYYCMIIYSVTSTKSELCSVCVEYSIADLVYNSRIVFQALYNGSILERPTVSTTTTAKILNKMTDKFHGSIFPSVQLPINQHFFLWFLCNEQTLNSYLNQHWSTDVVNSLRPSDAYIRR